METLAEHRTYDISLVNKAIAQSGASHLANGFDGEEWLADLRNVALQIGGNIGLFEHRDGRTCSAHWLFVDRGRRALDAAHAMMAEMFEHHGMLAIHGEVPTFHRASRMFCRWLGCKSLGIIDTPRGEVELFFMRWADMQRQT